MVGLTDTVIWGALIAAIAGLIGVAINIIVTQGKASRMELRDDVIRLQRRVDELTVELAREKQSYLELYRQYTQLEREHEDLKAIVTAWEADRRGRMP